MNTCPVSPFMHAMLDGACCDIHSERTVIVPARQEYPVESVNSAFAHAFA